MNARMSPSVTLPLRRVSASFPPEDGLQAFGYDHPVVFQVGVQALLVERQFFQAFQNSLKGNDGSPINKEQSDPPPQQVWLTGAQQSGSTV